jgi:hypothetical protein
MTTSYNSNSEFPLLSALLVIAAIHYPGQVAPAEPVLERTIYTESLMAPVPLPGTYSESAVLTQDAQAEILARFVSKLLENAKEPPQEAIDLLNKHFWELI